MTASEAKEILNRIYKSLDAYCGLNSDANKAFQMAIEALEESRWIPCKERLPDIGEEVLVTYSIDRRKKRFVYTAYWNGEEWLSVWDEFRAMDQTITYHAWKPLPEPYREEEYEQT